LSVVLARVSPQSAHSKVAPTAISRKSRSFGFMPETLPPMRPRCHSARDCCPQPLLQVFNLRHGNGTLAPTIDILECVGQLLVRHEVPREELELTGDEGSVEVVPKVAIHLIPVRTRVEILLDGGCRLRPVGPIG